MSNFLISDFKLDKPAFLANSNVSTPAVFLSLILLYNLLNLIQFLLCYCYGFVVPEDNSFYIRIYFLSIQQLK